MKHKPIYKNKINSLLWGQVKEILSVNLVREIYTSLLPDTLRNIHDDLTDVLSKSYET